MEGGEEIPTPKGSWGLRGGGGWRTRRIFLPVGVGGGQDLRSGLEEGRRGRGRFIKVVMGKGMGLVNWERFGGSSRARLRDMVVPEGKNSLLKRLVLLLILY